LSSADKIQGFEVPSSTRIIAIIPIYREVGKIGKVLLKFTPGIVDEICVVADAPTQAILAEIENAKQNLAVQVNVIENSQRNGIGFAIKQGFKEALTHEFDIIVVMAGNGKDDPREIPRLTGPILNNQCEYVQGSRFLPGGRKERNPLLRGLFSRLFPILWTWLTGVRCTDVTNGFRAYKTKILVDPRVHVWEDWLDHYELEYYIH